MWSVILAGFWRYALDEFQPQSSRERAAGIYINGFCLIGLYVALSARQYYLIIANCTLGLWYDEYADLENTLQYRFWRRLGVVK